MKITRLSLVAISTLLLMVSTATYANQRCQYRDGVIVEVSGVCPTGTVTLRASSGAYGSQLAEVFTSNAHNTTTNAANNVSSSIRSNMGPNTTVQRRRINELLYSGSISRFRAKQLKEDLNIR